MLGTFLLSKHIRAFSWTDNGITTTKITKSRNLIFMRNYRNTCLYYYLITGSLNCCQERKKPDSLIFFIKLNLY